MGIKDVAVKVEGVWLPKGEQHMLDWMTRGKGARRIGPANKITYQWGKQEKAMHAFNINAPDWRQGIFVDVGGHCGFWSMWWGREMHGIVAYEPIPTLRTIYEANVRENGVDWEDVTLLPFALSDTPGELAMKYNPSNTGATRVFAPKDTQPPNPFVATVETIDRTLEEALQGRRMSVLKIDCEGFEEKVVNGGINAIRKHRPCIVVEQKFEHRHFAFEKDGAVRALENEGYRVVKEMSGDHFMVPA
jgi:FkbM family methyltransferase